MGGTAANLFVGFLMEALGRYEIASDDNLLLIAFAGYITALH